MGLIYVNPITVEHAVIRFAHDMDSREYLENCLFLVSVVFLRYYYISEIFLAQCALAAPF